MIFRKVRLDTMPVDQLVARFAAVTVAQDPVPDPLTDFYMLDDDDVEAYSAFRHRLDAEARRGAVEKVRWICTGMSREPLVQWIAAVGAFA